MIVSNLESLFARLLLGGVIARAAQGSLSADVQANALAFVAWCTAPGITAAGAEELAALSPLELREWLEQRTCACVLPPE